MAKPSVEVRPGAVIGSLRIIAEGPKRGASRNRRIVCACECGDVFTTYAYDVAKGRTKTCPACANDQRGRRATTHGHATGPKSREYRTWQAMANRCTNPNASQWDYYGGRGITVCERWLGSFEDFLTDMGPRPDGTTIDRIDPNGNYEPGNCRWADYKTQRRNQRPSKAVLARLWSPRRG